MTTCSESRLLHDRDQIQAVGSLLPGMDIGLICVSRDQILLPIERLFLLANTLSGISQFHSSIVDFVTNACVCIIAYDEHKRLTTNIRSSFLGCFHVATHDENGTLPRLPSSTPLATLSMPFSKPPVTDMTVLPTGSVWVALLTAWPTPLPTALTAPPTVRSAPPTTAPTWVAYRVSLDVE